MCVREIKQSVYTREKGWVQYVTYSTATAICLSQYTIGSVTAKYTAQNDMTILFVRLVYPDSTVLKSFL